MSKNNLVEIVITIVLITIFIICGIVIFNEYKNNNINQEQQNCQHEFVTTSEFSLLSKNNYRIVSKCIKCGYIVK